MNIHKVRDNLEQTIYGKETFKSALRDSLHLISDVSARAECNMMLNMLELNIQDLRKILADLEKCSEKVEYDSFRTQF